ncbi:growth inhibitor PemK [Nocardioides sp. Root190]|uniref:type II toxin-antitoxin system PemK/MazF family toxin n=1 Tax=Nocardioides sp. Root190 TaxID=1736488 RepID=UPI0006F8F494|nr:type II toxin-antitoxin system PemK/MazF family toxin [Nocardioides sp. Root190]KRB79601.1 growth inhibitor PemK [Nocardioides sp. Root190]
MSDDVPDGTWAPVADGRPDPGEVVWAWVPYEDDPQQGKDRPVLVIGIVREPAGDVLRCLVMTSKDHDRDEAQEAAAGRFWMDVGTGSWDPRGRPSEVRLNRLVEIPAHGVRREGAALPAELYAAVIAARAPFAGPLSG